MIKVLVSSVNTSHQQTRSMPPHEMIVSDVFPAFLNNMWISREFSYFFFYTFPYLLPLVYLCYRILLTLMDIFWTWINFHLAKQFSIFFQGTFHALATFHAQGMFWISVTLRPLSTSSYVKCLWTSTLCE